MKNFFFVFFLSLSTLGFSQQIEGLTEKYQRLSPAIFKIYVETNYGSFAQGSGCIISSDGIAITNFHVLENASAILIELPSGESYRDIIILDYSDYDTGFDLVKFKIIGTKNLKFPFVPVSYSKQLIGESTFAIGYPMGLEGGSTLSTGIISGYRRENNQELLQTSTPITHGSSGGGLFNSKGLLCGITSGTYVEPNSEFDFLQNLHANLNKVIPTSKILNLNRTLNFSLSEFFSSNPKFASAELMLQNKNYEQALPLFIEQVNMNPNDGWGWFKIGICAYKIAVKPILENPTEYGFIFKSYDRKYINLAQDAFLHSKKLYPQNHYTYGYLALISMISSLGSGFTNYNMAIQYIKSCSKISSDDYFLNYIYGFYYGFVKKDFLQCIEYYSRAIHLYEQNPIMPDIASVYFFRGDAQFGVENYEQGWIDIDKSIELDPNNKAYMWSKVHYSAISSGLLGRSLSEGCETLQELGRKFGTNQKYMNKTYEEWQRIVCIKNNHSNVSAKSILENL